MKKSIKPLMTVIIFMILLLLITLIWYRIESGQSSDEIPINSFEDFLIYLLGYGDIQLPNIFSKTVFSIVSLLGLTLFSSIFTVNLFERWDKIKIEPKIFIWNKKSKTNVASVILTNGKKDMYNLNAKLILSYRSQVQTEEKYIPFISKKDIKSLEFNIAPGTVVYNFLRYNLKGDAVKPVLVFTAAYTDISKGHEYTVCKKYQYFDKNRSDIFFSPNSVFKAPYEQISHHILKEIEKKADPGLEKKVQNYILNNSFNIDLSSAIPINAEDIDISYGYSLNNFDLPPNKAFEAKVHMTERVSYNPSDFCIACVVGPLGSDWIKYYDLGCSLNFNYFIDSNITVTLEIKCALLDSDKENTIFFNLMPNDDFEKFTLKLNKYEREMFRTVSELCFTVFYKNTDAENHTGHFVISSCALEIEEEVKRVDFSLSEQS